NCSDMSGGVASPASDADSSNAEKTKKEKQVCTLCNVEIPPGPDSLQKHEAGKRHERMRAQCDAVEALAKRSVFIKIAPARAHSPVEMDTEGEMRAAPAKVDPRLRLQKEEIERVMARFGHIERVLCRAENGHFSIVEYGKDEEAKAALAAKSVLMACSSVAADGTATPIQMTTVLVTERRVNFSAAAPTEKHRINVDEIVDAVSQLIVDPADDAYTAAIDEIIRHMVLSEEQLRERDALASRLEEQLRKFFVSPSVRIFGSSITSIGTIDSDIDMCLMLASPSSIDNGGGNRRMQFLHEQKQRDKYTLLTGDAVQIRKKKVQAGEVKRLSGPDRVRFVSKMLNEVRKECGWMGVQRPVVDCRLPIVRFLLDREILVDLSVDNAIGVAKSAYIRDLIKADASGRLRRMLIGLRFWALSNGLFETQEKEHKGHFNAYMLNLLAISFLQSNGALPPFQHSDTPDYGGPGGKWRIDFVVPPYTLQAVTIQAFMKSFFIHMTSGVSLRESVIVGRTGEQLSLSEFVARYPDIIDRGEGAAAAAAGPTHAAPAATFEFALMNVQDPIEQSHNVTSTLNEKYVRKMRHMMMRSLHAMKGGRESFVSILSIEKRLARENARTPASGDVSMEENGDSRPTVTSSSLLRPLSAMVEPVKAEATVAVCYPREQPATMAAMMRASAFVFEKVLMAEELEDPTSSNGNVSGQSAAKRRRALSDEARERAEESRGGVREGRAEGEATSLVGASTPPQQPALYNWGIYALPARSWIGRRNVKRKLSKEHAGKEEIEIESLVSQALQVEAPTATVPHTITAVGPSPILIVRVEFGFHSDAMMMRFHRLEGNPLDLVNMSHFLEGNGLLAKYAHSLLPMLMENGGASGSSSAEKADDENKRPMSGGKRRHEEMEDVPMEM
ncbi:hypothetical protein PFISCL1PPCAC_23066, partial [Pristionchus fissidentatus]